MQLVKGYGGETVICRWLSGCVGSRAEWLSFKGAPQKIYRKREGTSGDGFLIVVLHLACSKASRRQEGSWKASAPRLVPAPSLSVSPEDICGCAVCKREGSSVSCQPANYSCACQALVHQGTRFRFLGQTLLPQSVNQVQCPQRTTFSPRLKKYPPPRGSSSAQYLGLQLEDGFGSSFLMCVIV